MNDLTNGSIWASPQQEPPAGRGRAEADIAEWRQLTTKVADLATSKAWSKAEVARRIGMPDGTFSQWYSGSYAGRLDAQNLKVRQWLDAEAGSEKLTSAIPAAPEFVPTRTALEIITALEVAQTLPDMVMVTLGAGMGKTHATRHYCATRPHAFRVTMRPKTKTCHAMLVEIGRVLNVNQPNPARLDSAIGARLQRNGRQTLLIVDECQNIEDRAVDQLRFFCDEYGCGIALVGNATVYGRFRTRDNGPDYTQIRRRVGKRLHRLQPYGEDITALIDAWGIDDPEQRKILTGIGRKPGALGQIDKTLKLAWLLAAGEGKPLAAKHISQAYQNREWED